MVVLDLFDAYIINPYTRQQLDRVLAHPTHAVLLTGPAGSGKHTLLGITAATILHLHSAESLEQYAYFKAVTPEKDKTAIGIEAVRELQQFAKLKLPGKTGVNENTARRIISIENADELTTEAQNAILKLLEEPPADTMFLLTASSIQGLLPTIRSRVQQLTVHRPARHDVERYFADGGHDNKAIAQAYFLSGGLPGLMHALLDDAEHPLKDTVGLARQLLQTSQFERLTKVDTLSKDKSQALQLLFVLQHMARAAIEQSAARAVASGTPADKPIRQWHKILRAAYDAERAYAVSAQAKLTLTILMLAL